MCPRSVNISQWILHSYLLENPWKNKWSVTKLATSLPTCLTSTEWNVLTWVACSSTLQHQWCYLPSNPKTSNMSVHYRQLCYKDLHCPASTIHCHQCWTLRFPCWSTWILQGACNSFSGLASLCSSWAELSSISAICC
jgi:hypothetical protein